MKRLVVPAFALLFVVTGILSVNSFRTSEPATKLSLVDMESLKGGIKYDIETVDPSGTEPDRDFCYMLPPESCPTEYWFYDYGTEYCKEGSTWDYCNDQEVQYRYAYWRCPKDQGECVYYCNKYGTRKEVTSYGNTSS